MNAGGTSVNGGRGERPHLGQPETVQMIQVGGAVPPVGQVAKNEPQPVGIRQNSGPSPEPLPHSPHRGVKPHPQPDLGLGDQDLLVKYKKPIGWGLAGLLGVAGLGGVIWLFNKWKDGKGKDGLKKKKKSAKNKERRHAREWILHVEN